jgi:hypothetical protein
MSRKTLHPDLKAPGYFDGWRVQTLTGNVQLYVTRRKHASLGMKRGPLSSFTHTVKLSLVIQPPLVLVPAAAPDIAR